MREASEHPAVSVRPSWWTGPRARRARTVLWWLLPVPWLAWTVIRFLGLERGTVAIQVMSFTPYAALLSLMPLLAALIVRRWFVAIVAGVICVTLNGSVLPRALGDPSTVDGDQLRVMSMNMRVGEADPATIVALVRSQRVDVLAVQELTPEAQRSLADHGIAEILPFSHWSTMDGAGGSGLYSRFQLDGPGRRFNPGGFTQTFATVRPRTGPPVWIEAVHPTPPLGGQATGHWRAGLRAEQPATVDGPLRILIGDFNATLDHRELRELIGTGYQDAASQVGAGLTPTWPFGGERMEITPKIAIDHVLADRRIRVRDFTAVAVGNTDHRAIIATLVL